MRLMLVGGPYLCVVLNSSIPIVGADSAISLVLAPITRFIVDVSFIDSSPFLLDIGIRSSFRFP